MIDDFDLYESLTKTSGIADETSKYVRAHSKEIGAALLGGALMSGLVYRGAKKGPNGEPSQQQQAAREALDIANYRKERSARVGNEIPFHSQVTMATAQATKDLSDAFAQDPKKAALMFAIPGAVGGMKILKILNKQKP